LEFKKVAFHGSWLSSLIGMGSRTAIVAFSVRRRPTQDRLTVGCVDSGRRNLFFGFGLGKFETVYNAAAMKPSLSLKRIGMWTAPSNHSLPARSKRPSPSWKNSATVRCGSARLSAETHRSLCRLCGVPAVQSQAAALPSAHSLSSAPDWLVILVSTERT